MIKILVVDDELPIANLIRMNLARQGYSVTCAYDGQEAADLLEKIEHDGLFATLEHGTFADIKRMRDGGKGLNGVVLRAEGYYNPFLNLLTGGAK